MKIVSTLIVEREDLSRESQEKELNLISYTDIKGTVDSYVQYQIVLFIDINGETRILKNRFGDCGQNLAIRLMELEIKNSNLTPEDFTLANIIVEDIIENTDVSKIEEKLTDIIKDFEGNITKKKKFLIHLNALFGNVFINELTWRHQNADERAIEARKVTKQLREKVTKQLRENETKHERKLHYN